MIYIEGERTMLKWIKKHKVFMCICFVFIVIGVPFIIHCLFKLHPTEKFSFLLQSGAQENCCNIMVVFLRLLVL